MTVHGEEGFNRAIHNIQNSPFRTKFEKDIEEFNGNLGIGCISDNEAQPLLVKSHLGSFAITTVGRINNLEALKAQAVAARHLRGDNGPMRHGARLLFVKSVRQNPFVRCGLRGVWLYLTMRRTKSQGAAACHMARGEKRQKPPRPGGAVLRANRRGHCPFFAQNG